MIDDDVRCPYVRRRIVNLFLEDDARDGQTTRAQRRLNDCGFVEVYYNLEA